ncbi:hypothetical protein F5Y04DRAFT_287251 [Hypomontagnella monticulosa]|nr:hypothetical protein F5Y04DRAFT_287251 [Hypomontagnella monticulosa]
MDPLSITASVFTLGEAATKLYHLLRSICQADMSINNLCVDLQKFTRILKSIDETLRNCRDNRLAPGPNDKNLWEQIDAAIGEYKRLLNEFEVIVHRINPSDTSNTIFKKTTVAAKLYFHSKDVIHFQENIRMANSSLQTLLQVITVSLSLRNNESQELVFQELRSLKRSLPRFYRTTTNSDSGLPPDESRSRLAKHLDGFFRAARDFHSRASTTASCIGSSRGSVAAHIDTRDTESIISPSISPTDLGDNCVENSGFNNILSGGLSKVAQRAIQQLDLQKAEEVLIEALKQHETSGRDNGHRRRLQTKSALSSLLQGKCRQAEDFISCLLERDGENDVITCQLLYALALLHLQNMNFEAAKVEGEKVFKEISEQRDACTLPGKNDVLTLLAKTYRLSGKTLWAEAIETECNSPETPRPVPNVVDFIASCPELRTELFGPQSPMESTRSIIRMKRLPLATDLTLLQLHGLQGNVEEQVSGSLLDERMQNAMKKNTGVHTNLTRFVSHLRRRQSQNDSTKARNETCGSTIGYTTTKNTLKRRRTAPSNMASNASSTESHHSRDGSDTSSPTSRRRQFRWGRLWTRTQPRETSDSEEHFKRVMSWIQEAQVGCTHSVAEGGATPPTSEPDDSCTVPPEPMLLENTQLAELADTSPRVELEDTRISPPQKSSTIPSLPNFYNFLLPAELGDTSVTNMNIEHENKEDPNNSQTASIPESSPIPGELGDNRMGGTEIPNEHATPCGHKRAYGPEDETSKRPRVESSQPCNIATDRRRPEPYRRLGGIRSARGRSYLYQQEDLADRDNVFCCDGPGAPPSENGEQAQSKSIEFPLKVDINNRNKAGIGSRIAKSAVVMRAAATRTIPISRKIFRYRLRSRSFIPVTKCTTAPRRTYSISDQFSDLTVPSTSCEVPEELYMRPRPHEDGLTRPYDGPIAFIGPFTYTTNPVQPYWGRGRIGGVPLYPHDPDDIIAPVELAC